MTLLNCSNSFVPQSKWTDNLNVFNPLPPLHLLPLPLIPISFNQCHALQSLFPFPSPLVIYWQNGNQNVVVHRVLPIIDSANLSVVIPYILQHTAIIVVPHRHSVQSAIPNHPPTFAYSVPPIQSRDLKTWNHHSGIQCNHRKYQFWGLIHLQFPSIDRL